MFFSVKFSVPWGHIAGREWGDPAGKHVLALHGESLSVFLFRGLLNSVAVTRMVHLSKS